MVKKWTCGITRYFIVVILMFHVQLLGHFVGIYPGGDTQFMSSLTLSDDK